MKHGFIKVAAATPRVTVADCKANGEEILKAVRGMNFCILQTRQKRRMP